MPFFLETNRLVLRQITAVDAPRLFSLDNDPDVMRYINGGIPTPIDVFNRDILPTYLHYDERSPTFGFRAAVEKKSGKFVGWFSLRIAGSTPNEAVLGYRLCKESWGQGYAAEGARALIDKGFAETHVQRITATTYQENVGSIRVMEKVGMTLVRRFKMTPEVLLNSDTHYSGSGEVWDGFDLTYAINRADWAHSQQSFNSRDQRRKRRHE